MKAFISEIIDLMKESAEVRLVVFIFIMSIFLIISAVYASIAA